MTEIAITPQAPIQAGNAVLLRVTFADELGAAVDVSAGTTPLIVLRAPSGVTSSLAATMTTDGVDGTIEAQATLAEFGSWAIQGRITLDSATRNSGRGTFPVEPNL